MSKNTRPTSEDKDARERIPHTISFLPRHETIAGEKLRERPELKGNLSKLIQELLEMSENEDPRAAAYLKARDESIGFEEDCAALAEAAGYKVKRNAKIDGGHRVDMLVENKGKQTIVELKSSGRRDRLELALGSALILSKQAKLPLVVCVPYIMDEGLVNVFRAVGVCLCTPPGIVDCIKNAIGPVK